MPLFSSTQRLFDLLDSKSIDIALVLAIARARWSRNGVGRAAERFGDKGGEQCSNVPLLRGRGRDASLCKFVQDRAGARDSLAFSVASTAAASAGMVGVDEVNFEMRSHHASVRWTAGLSRRCCFAALFSQASTTFFSLFSCLCSACVMTLELTSSGG